MKEPNNDEKVTVFQEYHKDDLVASMKRGADGKALPKKRRENVKNLGDIINKALGVRPSIFAPVKIKSREESESRIRIPMRSKITYRGVTRSPKWPQVPR